MSGMADMTAEPGSSNGAQTGVCDEGLVRGGLAGLGRSFYGGAVDNLELAPMGKGHGNAGRPFDIESACYLKPVYAEYDDAVANGTRRKIVLKAGVKTLKSFSLEVCAADHTCNRSGDAAIFFGTADAAETTATTRILDFFKGNDLAGGGIPRFKAKMETVVSRFDETMGGVKFPDKTLFILAANLGNTQQKNLAFVGLQDAFVTGATGMIEEMIARTTQYENEAIIFLESQGGEEGFDFDRHYDLTDQRELHVRCTECGSAHIFNWKAFDEESMTRGPEFIARPPLIVPSLDHEAWVAHHRPLLLKPENRVAGFKRGADELIKFDNGDYNEKAVLKETHFECFHCGSRWLDTPVIREKLDVSSFYVAARPEALWYNVGFNIPQWINRRLAWGPMMLNKLQCQRTASELGNYEPLKIWWQKTAARTWSKNINAKSPEKIGATIYELDPKKKDPNELCKVVGIDFQFNGTHLPYQCWSIGRGTRPRLLHWEWIKPAGVGLSDEEARRFCKDRARELNKQFEIEPPNCMIDCGHRPDLVRDWAAEDAVMAPVKDHTGRRFMKWFTYGLLIGDDRVSYKHAHPGRAPTWVRYKQFEWVNVDTIKDGRRVRIAVHHRLWSNPSIKEIAVRWRDGDGAPKIEVHENFLKDASKDGFWAQMNSERLLPWKGRPGKLRWDNEGRPNHAWDGFCMVMVRMDELECLNNFGAPPDDRDQ